MGRRSRRLSMRLGATVFAACTVTLAYQRWLLRRGSAIPIKSPDPSRPREMHLAALEGSSFTQPFDVLVVGGGVTGLYTAVDAAQRGLRVALVEAEDFGSGSTSGTPLVAPGAFAYVQRALRQRDTVWLGRAVQALRAQTVWMNVNPSSVCAKNLDNVESGVHTFIPALNLTEMLELTMTAFISTLLSPFCGSLRCCNVVTPWSLPRVFAEKPEKVYGGVTSADGTLHGVRAALSLARTAEALGGVVVNYAPLCGIRYVNNADCVLDPRSLDELQTSSGTSAVVVATIRDDANLSRQRYVSVYARGVINCAGAWADQVRMLFPDNVLDPVPTAYAKFLQHSYFVVPQEAVCMSPSASSSRFSSSLTLLPQYSCSSVMALPWQDNCMLIGPWVAPLPNLPPKGGPCTVPKAVGTERVKGDRVPPKDGLVQLLKKSGIQVHPDRVLSCLSSVVPVLRDLKELPWAEEIIYSGYSVRASQPSEGNQTDSMRSPWRRSPVVHVYGGVPLLSRDIAEKAVDLLLKDTDAISPEKQRGFFPCRTKNLALEVPSSLAGLHSADMQPTAQVEGFVRDGFAVRLSDIVARRTNVAYSSPGEALRALPFILNVMAERLGWDKSQQAAEMLIARRFVESVAVKT